MKLNSKKTQMSRIEKLRLLDNLDCFSIKFNGERPFSLHGGDVSRTFVNLKKLYANPISLEKIMKDLSKVLEQDKPHIICGVPEGATPFASILSQFSKIPFITVSQGKVRGSAQIDYGPVIRCVLVEDVITSGTSCMETVQVLRNFFAEKQVEIVRILCIVCRNPIPKIQVFSWLHLNVHTARIEYVARRKSSRLVFACDLPSWEQVEQCVHAIGSYICILKIHSALYQKGWEHHACQLREWSRKYKFLVMEDAKIADIGSIVERWTKSISEWADLITVVPVSGSRMIQHIHPDLGVFLLAKYSTSDQLLDANYLKNVCQMAEQNQYKVCGFICQEGVDSNFLHAMPGISLSMKRDGYETLEEKQKKGCDLFIVGRDIYREKTFQGMIMKAKRYANL